MLKRGKDLKAIYKNEEFYAAIREGLVNIVSYDERTEEEGFEETNKGYWIKRIKIEDEDLEELSEFIFYVRYKDRIIENEIWEVTYLFCIHRWRIVYFNLLANRSLVIHPQNI